MGGVRGVIVVKNDELFLLAALDNLGRARVELSLDLADNWENERGEKAEDEDVELL